MQSQSYANVSFVPILTSDRFERAKANGDKQAAGESLRRFFEQRFSESTDSLVILLLCLIEITESSHLRDLRQHATLHHVRMHIATGHTAAARKVNLPMIGHV